MKPLVAFATIKNLVNDPQYSSKIPSIDAELEVIEDALKENGFIAKNKDMSVVCQCRKCGHLLYIGIDEETFKTLEKIDTIYCPSCGEEGGENWILRGVDDYNNRKIY